MADLSKFTDSSVIAQINTVYLMAHQGLLIAIPLPLPKVVQDLVFNPWQAHSRSESWPGLAVLLLSVWFPIVKNPRHVSKSIQASGDKFPVSHYRLPAARSNELLYSFKTLNIVVHLVFHTHVILDSLYLCCLF
jgi:hypothetical protein